MTRKLLLSTLMLLLTSVLYAQGDEVIGRWKTIDDETGKPKSVVEIFKKGDKLYGKIIKLFREPNEDQNPKCDKCDDHRKNQQIIGMEIISALSLDDEEWSGGKILDPKTGKIYTCKLWYENGKLQVRGYVGFFFRTQTWVKYSG